MAILKELIVRRKKQEKRMKIATTVVPLQEENKWKEKNSYD